MLVNVRKSLADSAMSPAKEAVSGSDGANGGEAGKQAGTDDKNRAAMTPPSPTPSAASASSGRTSPVKRRRGPSISGLFLGVFGRCAFSFTHASAFASSG